VVNRSRIQYGLLCLAVPLAACSGTSAAPARGRGAEGGAVPVVVAQASQRDVPVDIDGIGNVEAYSTISVRAQTASARSSRSSSSGWISIFTRSSA